jgi:hypothetical protein
MMIPTARALLIAVCWGLAAALAPLVAAASDSRAAVGAPTLNVGDAWTYRVVDGYTKIDQGSSRQRIRDISGGRVSLEVAREDGRAVTIEVYDLEWGWLRRPATNLELFEYDPAYRAFEFPLAPGRTWRAHLTASDPETGQRYAVRIDARVLGWDRIRVPAGEFDALKVRRLVYIDKVVALERGRAEIVEHDWYAPSVAHVVRREATSRHLSDLYGDFGVPNYIEDGWTIEELVSYSPRR